jgi:hypothetical protein
MMVILLVLALWSAALLARTIATDGYGRTEPPVRGTGGSVMDERAVTPRRP